MFRELLLGFRRLKVLVRTQLETPADLSSRRFSDAHSLRTSGANTAWSLDVAPSFFCIA